MARIGRCSALAGATAAIAVAAGCLCVPGGAGAGGRAAMVEIGAGAGYFLAKETYGDDGDPAGGGGEETHRYGGFAGSLELGVKWTVDPLVRVGMRFWGYAGYLSHPCTSTACGYDGPTTDCTCEYETYVSGGFSPALALDVTVLEWMWIDIVFGPLFPIDARREPSIGLIAGAGLGFSFPTGKAVTPFLRLELAVTPTLGNGLAVLPNAAAGIRF